MTIEEYLSRVTNQFKTGIAREHSYRGYLQDLLESLTKDVLVTNEPARIACGAPDYILTKRNIPVGYIEAKDIGVDLSSKTLKEQFERYRASLDNLIITDYLDFHLYRDGEFVTAVKIAEIRHGQIIPVPGGFADFDNLIKDFVAHQGQTIKSSKKLAEMMAGKARMLASVIENALLADEEEQRNKVYESANNTLRDQLAAFQTILIHDIKPKEFADIYAQTIAYGMFAARLHDPSLPTFTRQEAAELIPKTNPFLRKLFQYIAGYDLDTRITWIVDGLADLFRATDVAALLKNFGKATQTNDPIIHFYETFLSEYDPKLRKSRGVWYTPEPVVKFIVRAVDDILKSEFGLPEGLADTSKTKIKVRIQDHDKRNSKGYKEIEQEVHKVQILDPATGTGTFLAEVVKHIYKKFEGQQGIWSKYVDQHLIPRLNGFELLMASYAMAHLKLDLLLTETGYKSTVDQRFRIYLTNSLEESHPDTGTLFANWLSTEANEANNIKRNTPVMCVIGNPPYSGESANKGTWIMQLMEDYKKEPGGKEKLKERNPKWINDDYVKFLRFGQHFIEKNGSGVLAFINPHGFLDNPTFRGMRWNLLKTYDKIYTIDLHGNAKKKETAPDGSPDLNVFDIMQGVSINLFVKTGKKSADLGKVFHFDLFGKRDFKYAFLGETDIKDILFIEIQNNAPNYYFVNTNFAEQKGFDQGFGLEDMFPISTVGIVTSKDAILINENKQELLENVSRHYGIVPNPELIKEISYRPLDNRYVYYDVKIIERAREKVMRHFVIGPNLGLVVPKINKEDNCFFIANRLIGHKLCSAYDINTVFPIYLYPENSSQQTIEATTQRNPNVNLETVSQITEKLGLRFTNEKETTKGTFSPIDILDYIYAVLHSPAYREKYKEFLKIDFPRVPYPKDQETFWSLVKLGGEIRQIHLLESPVVSKFITGYPEDGTNIVEKPTYKAWNIYINESQYFSNVPQVAWEFYIGGYQPAQKWLKDRKGRELSFEDIQHYQKIIVALSETDRLMKEVDKVGVL